jgi:hypothetical protein
MCRLKKLLSAYCCKSSHLNTRTKSTNARCVSGRKKELRPPTIQKKKASSSYYYFSKIPAPPIPEPKTCVSLPLWHRIPSTGNDNDKLQQQLRLCRSRHQAQESPGVEGRRLTERNVHLTFMRKEWTRFLSLSPFAFQ